MNQITLPLKVMDEGGHSLAAGTDQLGDVFLSQVVRSLCRLPITKRADVLLEEVIEACLDIFEDEAVVNC